jgi:hypothetical protein
MKKALQLSLFTIALLSPAMLFAQKQEAPQELGVNVGQEISINRRPL